MKIKHAIQDYLLDDGIPPNIKGFHYLADAIELYHPQISVMKELYHSIAQKWGVTPCSVDKAMRHAISKSNIKDCLPVSEYISYARLIVEREVEYDVGA